MASAFSLLYPDRVQSLSILDISPVKYTANELSSVCDTIMFLAQSTEKLLLADSKQAVSGIIREHVTEDSMHAFLMSQIQPSSEGKGFEWKLHVDPLYQGLEPILNFDLGIKESETYPFTGPTLLMKAGKSDFVRTKHIDSIKLLFPSYVMCTIRDASHWLHVEKPKECAEVLNKFIQSTYALTL